jgi:uncharacterized protein with gpF-like domain
MDHKVRPTHLEKEGKVFRKDQEPLPEDDYNCRCWAEPVTQNITIIDNTYGGLKSFEQFIRYGGGATIVISG